MSNKNAVQPPKSQWWASIVYPNENVTIEYLDKVVIKFHMPCIISPLHDRDSKDGFPFRYGLRGETIIDEWKDKHYHIMFMFVRAVKKESYEYIKDRFMDYGIQLVGSEMIKNGTSMARYFCHMDNPEKHQYSTRDYLYYGGLDEGILNLDKMNKVQTDKIRRSVAMTIFKYKFTSIEDVCLYFESIGESFITDYCLKNTAMVEKLCRDQFYKVKARDSPRHITSQ